MYLKLITFDMTPFKKKYEIPTYIFKFSKKVAPFELAHSKNFISSDDMRPFLNLHRPKTTQSFNNNNALNVRVAFHKTSCNFRVNL